MLQKLRFWLFGSLQVKILLLIVSSMLLLMAVFVFYNVQIQQQSLENALQQKGTSMALTGAAAVEHFFEDAIVTGRLTEDEVFDTGYQPIPNTNPQKYNTAYDDLTDVNLLNIQDAYLKDLDVLYAVAVDTNGYLPTHNTRYASPLTGDYETDLTGNRTKRIFDDDIGIAAAKNTAPSLFQIYFRDTGEVAWDISAPIMVNDRHWGGFRVGFSLEDVDAQTTALAWRITIAAALLAVAVGVSSYLIARQIVGPIKTLANAAQQLGEGDLDVEVEVKSHDELGQLGQAFNTMANQLKDLVDTLEQRIANRTQRLELVASMSEQLSAILDVDQLLTELVNQVKNKFSYYHAHVYIINREGDTLVMRAGVGEAGAAMKAQGHSIPLRAPTSLVARAARTGQMVSIDNVREAKDWLSNPLLPNTYSEMVVPIILEQQVVGVLDVQQDKIAGLDESDANVLRSLANQVAVAMRNARLFREAESALAEVRAAQERYVAQSWQLSRSDSNVGEQIYIQPGMPELSEATLKAAEEKALVQEHPAIVPIDEYEGSPKPLVAPISLGGQPIGTLQLHKLDVEDTSKLWTAQDLEFVETILDQVAQTAENLRLFDETRERAGREQTIREITDKLRAASDLEQLISIATEELAGRLSATHAELELGIEEQLPEGGNGHQVQN